MAIDEDGRSLLINKKQSVLLHRFSFKGPVKAAEFSPDGQFIACAVGRVLQVRGHQRPKTQELMPLHALSKSCARSQPQEEASPLEAFHH